ncbi:HIT family protein [Longimicrobium sp.]|uniref:HIT family protein n=1 Tax=Longimicrobium sp. TaxID=2029185 RepID=UPI002E35DEF5|nr:HIT family protein [Longimicrobium sp.]HEX6042386.1 HIT family protein [Longimicrobium sp.]
MADCLFCAIAHGEAPASMVHQDARCVVFMDIHPVRPGHVLVASRRHAVQLHELPPDERAALFELAVRVGEAQAAAGLPRQGGTLVVNDGPAAGQHVPHVHVHVIPRARGDLPAVLRAYAGKLFNHFGRAANRSALDALAGRIRAHLALPEAPE